MHELLSLNMNTFKLVKETQVDQRKDGYTNTHEDERNQKLAGKLVADDNKIFG